MSNMMKKSLAVIALLLVASTASAQTPVLKKPVVLAPQVKPALPPAVLKTPITVVNPASIVSNSPNREEAARRLKAQNVPVAAALAALRSAFTSSNGRSSLLALQSAGYATPDLMVALKQADNLSAASMVRAMAESGIPAAEWTPSMPQLYTLNFDALLADLRSVPSDRQWFGYALDAMNYNVQQMVETGYRYFNGRFLTSHSNGGPYPGPGELYALLKYKLPLAEHLQVNDYTLWVKMMNAGYSPVQIMSEIKIANSDPRGVPVDDVSRCMTQPNFVREGSRTSSPNPALVIRIAPDGSATHSDVQRDCYVQFLEKLKDQGASRAFARQLAEVSVMCIPDSNPGCPAHATEVYERMVTAAGYPPESN